MGFIENSFLSKSEAAKVADVTDKYGDNIDTDEINDLIIKNKQLSLKVRKEAKKAYETLQKTQGNDIIKSDFFKILTKQEAEHKNILTKHESSKRTIKKETQESKDLIENKDINYILNSIRYSKESSESDIRLLQETLNNLGANLKVDGDWGKNTRKELLKAKVEKSSNNKGAKTKVDIINSANGKTADKYMAQLNVTEALLKSYEINLGDNGEISKHIGVIGILREMTNDDAQNFLDSLVGIAEKEAIINAITSKAKGNPKKMNAMLSTAVKALISYGLSGGASVSISIFGVNIGSHMVKMGTAQRIAGDLGVKDPVNLAKVLNDPKTNASDIEKISDKISSRNFDGGAEKMAMDQTIFGKTPALIKTLFKFLGVGNDLYNLLEKFEDKNTTANQRAEITSQISIKLDNYKKDIDNDIASLKKGNELSLPYDTAFKYGVEVGGENDVTLTKDMINDGVKELELKKENLNSLLQDTAYAVENRHTDTFNSTKTVKENVSEMMKFAKSFDFDNKLSKPTKELELSGGKFGRALPLDKNWDSWFEHMQTSHISGKEGVTALGYIIGTLQQKGELSKGKIDLDKLKIGLKNGNYLLPANRDKFKETLTGNMASSGNRNLLIKNYGIYTFEVGGYESKLKQNCANPQDTTPNVNAYIEEGDFFDVTATIDLKKTKTINKTETHKENQQEEVTKTRTGYRTENEEVTGYRTETEEVTGYTTETTQVEIANTSTEVSNSATDIDAGIVDSGNAAGAPPVDGVTTTPSVSTTTYHTETVTTQVPYSETVTTQVPYTETITRQIPYTETYTELVDNWVDVTNNWIEYIKVPAKLNLFKSAIASIGFTAINEKDFVQKVTKEAIKAGIPESKAVKGAKELGRARSKVVPIGGKVEGENIILKSNKEVKEQETYTIVGGDTLSEIAKKFKTNYKTLAKINGIKPPYIIKTGKIIKLK